MIALNATNGWRAGEVGMNQKVEFIESYIKIGNGDYQWNDNHGELIRCKDCKHGQYEEWDNGECVDKTVFCDGYGIHKPDWFCADGERRTDDA